MSDKKKESEELNSIQDSSTSDSKNISIKHSMENLNSLFSENIISEYLDQNPEFLVNYLRKLQLHKRQSLDNDINIKKLSNIYANLRLNLNNLVIDENPKYSNNNVKLSNNINRRDNSFPTKNRISEERKNENDFSNQHNQNNSFKDEINSKDKKGFEGSRLFPDNFLLSRKHFKDLTFYEKTYALVKILYESLDLKTTCKKILKTVSLLLDADRCSLFLVVDDDEYESKALISIVFDAHDNSYISNEDNLGTQIEKEIFNEEIKLPIGAGIVGHVALTASSLNIENAYQDERFNSSIDQKTGYKTKSILCLPILDEQGECIAVAEAINKLSDDNNVISFNKKDEETFCKFMPFIAIAIRNSNLYTKSKQEALKNKILLDLASTVFDEQTTVDNLVSKILLNSLLLLECEHCQIVLFNSNKINDKWIFKKTANFIDRVYEFNQIDLNSSENAFGYKVEPVSINSTKYPLKEDLMDSVSATGEVINIKNTHSSAKIGLHYTGSVLCVPVKNNSEELVAVIFAYNKIINNSYSNFTHGDISVAKAFALFCGIGIQNVIMYEKVVRAMNMQQVALDVLSYHSSPNQEEVETLKSQPIEKPFKFDVHLFTFDEQTLDDFTTVRACLSIFYDLDLIGKFRIPHDTLCRFFLTVRKNYRPVAYHNWRHGFNVMCSMYTILTEGQLKNKFSDLEILSLLVACICHDVDHRGTTNTFQIKIQSPLAKLYSTSIMEQHHFNQCIMILHNNMNNILLNLNQKDYQTALVIIEKSILATDLTLHFEKVDFFIQKTVNEKSRNFETPEDKELFMSMLMTACDLSASFKKWDCHYRLSKLVASEFFQQGDIEKEKFNNEPIDIMNRKKEHKLPEMQINFLNSVCLPLYNALYLCNPLLKKLPENCESNIEKWKSYRY